MKKEVLKKVVTNRDHERNAKRLLTTLRKNEELIKKNEDLTKLILNSETILEISRDNLTHIQTMRLEIVALNTWVTRTIVIALGIITAFVVFSLRNGLFEI